MPKYNMYTGELEEFNSVRKLHHIGWHSWLVECKLSIRKHELKTMKIFKWFTLDNKIYWLIDNKDYCERFDLDLLYDLQQAGLVEKVEE